MNRAKHYVNTFRYVEIMHKILLTLLLHKKNMLAKIKYTRTKVISLKAETLRPIKATTR